MVGFVISVSVFELSLSLNREVFYFLFSFAFLVWYQVHDLIIRSMLVHLMRLCFSFTLFAFCSFEFTSCFLSQS